MKSIKLRVIDERPEIRVFILVVLASRRPVDEEIAVVPFALLHTALLSKNSVLLMLLRGRVVQSYIKIRTSVD